MTIWNAETDWRDGQDVLPPVLLPTVAVEAEPPDESCRSEFMTVTRVTPSMSRRAARYQA
jgi:hypothetical protein